MKIVTKRINKIKAKEQMIVSKPNNNIFKKNTVTNKNFYCIFSGKVIFI